ncbi:MAG: type IV pili methyl-accepting chemotaxis transducer N-terminal domain-containing protein [Rubrivivax sp.]|nr:type IV pili methyl-accepting chemotaxis transducer N-terminal domain-containing protein [Rubrivivax sp.]
MNRRRVPLALLALFSACASWQLPVSAQSVVSLSAVATAGKQRMLSQRVLKAYSQLVLGVMPEKASIILSSSVDELRSANALLQSQAKAPLDTDLRAQAALVDKLAAVVSAPPTAKGLQQAVVLSEELLLNAETVTQGFIKAGGDAPSAMVNLAAKQRMLSQRAAAAYLVYQTEARSPEMKARATSSARQFMAALSVFEDAKAEFPAIADRIDLARMQMIFFDNALSNIDNPRKEQFTTVAATSERVLSEMDLMTRDFIKQLATRNATASPATGKKP